MYFQLLYLKFIATEERNKKKFSKVLPVGYFRQIYGFICQLQNQNYYYNFWFFIIPFCSNSILICGCVVFILSRLLNH